MTTALAVAATAPRAQGSRLGVSRAPLGSWKEIASFFDKTIRTVQRWERKENLPIHRHVHHNGSTVYAFETELLAWRDARCQYCDKRTIRGWTASRRLRLAVLPFANLSRDHQENSFEDALTYELIVQLSRLDPARLGVIAYTSAMRYKNSDCNIAQIGCRLKVDFVLEGSVRLASRRVRMAAQLINVRDQMQLFADACARRWADDFTIQVSFAERMTEMIKEHLLAASCRNFA